LVESETVGVDGVDETLLLGAFKYKNSGSITVV
jgi:hypothetical protein